jgi:hypothetical protein
VRLTTANFVDTVVGLDLAGDPNHKDVIAAAAARIVDRLSHVQPHQLGRLLGDVQDQVRGRHLQVHVNDPAGQRELAAELVTAIRWRTALTRLLPLRLRRWRTGSSSPSAGEAGSGAGPLNRAKPPAVKRAGSPTSTINSAAEWTEFIRCPQWWISGRSCPP